LSILTHTGPRLIANDALRKVYSPWMLAVSDRAGFAERYGFFGRVIN
jgi:hypothetical protein